MTFPWSSPFRFRNFSSTSGSVLLSSAFNCRFASSASFASKSFCNFSICSVLESRSFSAMERRLCNVSIFACSSVSLSVGSDISGYSFKFSCIILRLSLSACSSILKFCACSFSICSSCRFLISSFSCSCFAFARDSFVSCSQFFKAVSCFSMSSTLAARASWIWSSSFSRLSRSVAFCSWLFFCFSNAFARDCSCLERSSNSFSRFLYCSSRS